MPRSLTNPLTGQIVWYFAASPPAAAPIASLVVASLAGRPVSATASAMTWANGVVTATIPAQPGERIGTQYPITVSGVTPAGYNGSYMGTVTSPTSITYPLAANPGAVTVQGTIAWASGYTAGGINAEFYNLVTFDPTAGTATFVASIPFLYGVRAASGAWCTMMRVNEPLPGAWPTQLEAMQYAEHGLTESEKAAAAEARIEAHEAAAEEAAQAAAAMQKSNGNGNGNPGHNPGSHTRSRARTSTAHR